MFIPIQQCQELHLCETYIFESYVETPGLSYDLFESLCYRRLIVHTIFLIIYSGLWKMLAEICSDFLIVIKAQSHEQI